MSQFHTGTQSISELLGQITGGRLGLPEFQRRFRWDRDRVRGLLVSILNDYPVGSLLLYCPGNPKLFGRRPLEGAPALSLTPTDDADLRRNRGNPRFHSLSRTRPT